jgi:hypothetical protein
MPVVGAISAVAASAGSAVYQGIQSGDANAKATQLMEQQNQQQQAAITTAQNQQSEYIRQQALIGQRDASLASERSMAAFRSNFAGTQLTQPGGVTPQAGMSMTKIGG